MSRIQRREQLLAKMKAMPEAVRQEIKKALAAGADQIMGDMQRLAPVSSTGNHGNPPGALRASIKQTWGGGKARYASLNGVMSAGDPDLTVRISAGNPRVRYAHLVEFGTAPHINGGKFAGSKHPGTTAQPFFFPAYRANKRRVKARISRATTKAVKALAAS